MLIKNKYRVWGDGLWVKQLLCKYEHLGSDPQSPHEVQQDSPYLLPQQFLHEMGSRDKKLYWSFWGTESTACSKQEALPQTGWKRSPKLSSDLHMCMLVFTFMNVHTQHTHTHTHTHTCTPMQAFPYIYPITRKKLNSGSLSQWQSCRKPRACLS